MVAMAGLLNASQSALAARTSGNAAVDADPERILAHVLPELRDGARAALSRNLPVEGQFDNAYLLNMIRDRAGSPPRFAPDTPGVSQQVIPGLAGDPDVTVYVVNAAPEGQRPIIVHVHGGGFIVGSAVANIPALHAQALALDCIIVSVEYRLSPEASFPQPVNDAYAGLLWAYRNSARLGGDPKRIAVQGASAGGGLAAMLAIAARDRGEIPLVHQSLIYPMLDDRTGQRPLPFPIGSFAWTAPLNRAGWSAFLGQPAGSRKVPHGSVPARVKDLAGLPDAFIGVGSLDLFVLEDIDYGKRLIESGVSTQIEVVPGAFHGFDVTVARSKAAQHFRLAQFTALARAFGTPLANDFGL